MKTIQDLINFFEPIPEGEWVSHLRGGEYGPHCALGHLDTVFGDSDDIVNAIIPKNSVRYWKYFLSNNSSERPGASCLAQVNNGNTAEYQQPTEKQRVLAFLHDLKFDKEISEVNIDEIKQIIEKSSTLELVASLT